MLSVLVNNPFMPFDPSDPPRGAVQPPPPAVPPPSPADLDRLGGLLVACLGKEMDRSPEFRTLMVELAGWILRRDAEDRGGGGGATAGASAPDDDPGASENAGGGDRRGSPARVSGESVVSVVPLVIGDSAVEVAVTGDRASVAAAHASAPAQGEGRDRPIEKTRPDEPGPRLSTATGASGSSPGEIDLRLIEARSSLKGAACLLAIERRAAAGDAEAERPVLERMNDQIAHAKAMTNCFLWSFWPYEEQPDDDRLRSIAGCYEALSVAAGLCARLTDAPPVSGSDNETADAFWLLAEASSALRVAVGWSWLPSDDVDQEESHLWLRRQTEERSIYVPRYMRLDDPADPSRAAGLIADCRAAHAELDERAARVKKAEACLNRLRYHARRFPEDGPDGAPQGRADAHDCRRVNEVVGDLADTCGVAPTDARVREALAGVRVSAFDAETPPNPAVLSALAPVTVRENGTSRIPVSPATRAPPRAWSERVLGLRALLGGGLLVVVGGERRPDAVERIREAFGLAEVVWVELSEHGTGQPMRAPISRVETVLVVVIIKLTGHLHADEARAYARDADKPCVLLMAGYNPEQIAAAVEEQALDRLRAKAVAD